VQNYYHRYAEQIAAHGYDVTPVIGKRPIVPGWQSRPIDAADYNKYRDCSVGVVLGGQHNVIAVDVDVTNPFAASQLEAMVEELLGNAPRRVGKAPKFLMVFRCSQLITKMRSQVYTIDGDDCAVEILAEGQQFVALGMHPDTRKPYTWPDDRLSAYPVAELTVVTPEQLRAFLASAETVMATYGQPKGRSNAQDKPPRLNPPATGGLHLKQIRGKRDEIEAALAYIPNDDLHYDDWCSTLHALKGALGEDGRELAHRWSRRSGKYEADRTDQVWTSIQNVRDIGAGSIFYWAEQYGFDLDVCRAPKFAGPQDLKPQAAPATEPPRGLGGMGLLRAADIRGPVRERQWLLEQWFPARAVSALFGQGGVGKTLLAQQLANCVAAGEPFLGLKTRRMPVLAIFCEDDAEELSRRQISINAWRGVNEITGSAPSDFFLWPRVGEDNILLTFPSAGEAVAGEFYGQIVEAVQAIKSQTGSDEILVIVDTAADTYGGNENVRREVNTFIKSYLGSLCVHHGATVLMLAHPSMSGMASGSGMSGSTAWENSVRARAYFSRAEDEDDDVRTLSRKKSNYSAIGAATDLTLIWDRGVYHLPTSPDQVERLTLKALKDRILDAVEGAVRAQSPFKARSGRKLLDALPLLLNERRKVVAKAVAELEAQGLLVNENRVGYRVARSARNYTGGS